MCGVVALWDDELAPDELARRAKAAAERLRHRGPDGEGVYVAPFGRVALAHRRLAIRGLGAQGAQPIVDPRGRGVLSYNGELFGAEAVRAELERAGVAFRGTSDTEVLLHALSHWGVPGALRRIHGQFAFVWLDLETRKLHLVRDRVGVRTLYYARSGRRLVAGSEQKALLPFAWVARRPRVAGMLRFLALGRTDDVPFETLLEGIEVLPPGYRAEWDGSELWIDRWFRFDVEAPESTVVELRSALERAVDEQLVSDVPIGATVSGGLDSSTVVMLADKRRAEARAGDKLHLYAYHDAFAEADERDHQRAVLAALASPHEAHWVSSSPDTFVDDLPRYLAHQEEPYQDLSSYAEYCIARRAAEDGVKVLLMGHGGDEVFVGYPSYFGPLMRELIADGDAPSMLHLFQAVTGIVGGPGRNARRDLLLAAGYHAIPAPARNAITAVRAAFASGLRGDSIKTMAGDAYRNWHRFDGSRATNSALRGSLESLTVARNLVHSDRMCLAFGVEGRVPLLDEALIRVAYGIPMEVRVSRRGLKESLRRAAHDVLPPLVRNRQWKLGFHAPITPYLAAVEDRLRQGHRAVCQVLDVQSRWEDLDVPGRWRWGNLGAYLGWVEEAAS